MVKSELTQLSSAKSYNGSMEKRLVVDVPVDGLHSLVPYAAAIAASAPRHCVTSFGYPI